MTMVRASPRKRQRCSGRVSATLVSCMMMERRRRRSEGVYRPVLRGCTTQLPRYVCEWSSGSPHELATSAIDAAERIKGQISDCAFTTTRCVDRCIHIKRLLISTSGKTSCRASLPLTSFAIRSTMYSHFCPSSFTSSSSSSLTFISFLSRYPNSFPPSEPVRFHFLRTIVGPSQSESHFLPTSLHRFPYNIHRPTLFRSPCHDG